jgi:hypothetical protein
MVAISPPNNHGQMASGDTLIHLPADPVGRLPPRPVESY